jgi:hypothetical protein
MTGKFVSSLQKASSENLSRAGFSEEAFFVSHPLSKGQIYGRLASKSGVCFRSQSWFKRPLGPYRVGTFTDGKGAP